MHLFAVMSSCVPKIKRAQKEPSSLSAQQEKLNVDFIRCMFVYKCGVTEQRIRSKKWILHFTLKTQMSTVNMITFGGGFQISWAKCHIFFLSLTVSLFQGHVSGAGHDLERKTQRENYYVVLCSNVTRKKINGVFWKERLRWERGGRTIFAKLSKNPHLLQFTFAVCK